MESSLIEQRWSLYHRETTLVHSTLEKVPFGEK
jgi:hypothetical protein